MPNKQKGLALMMLVFLFAFAVTAYTLRAFNQSGINQKRQHKTSVVLAEAKAALLGEVVRVEEAELGAKITEAIFFPNPDTAASLGEGVETSNLGVTDGVVLGKLPWRDLDFYPAKDGWGECLWYVVSGSYKRRLPTSLPYNWDRLGQIDVVDSNGNNVASNIIALIVSPGPVLNEQNRTLSDAGNIQCGGNYDAVNYLDPFNSAVAIVGNVNYFPGSTDNRSASTTLNKVFVLANNDDYNDKFILITVDDVFNLLVKRSDFVNEINIQINSAVSDISSSGLAPSAINKGTDGLNCSSATNEKFCVNWKEMFVLGNVAAGETVNGAACNTVLIFGGKKTDTQVRVSAFDKNNPANYLEGDNLDALNGIAGKNYFGSTQFLGGSPSADVVRCVS